MTENLYFVNVSATPSGTLFTRCFWYRIISLLTPLPYFPYLLMTYMPIVVTTQARELANVTAINVLLTIVVFFYRTW